MNPKIINSMNARLARLEALLESNDVFKAQGGATYGGLNYQGSTFNIESPQAGQEGGMMYMPGGLSDMGMLNFEQQQQMSPNLDQQLAENFGFGPNDMVVAELQQRISELELLVAGGSNDTFQGDALDAGAAVGDDGERGNGDSTPTAEEQATALGLGTMAYQAASAVAITGGAITGITDLAVADGGTGASTAADARTNLGLGTIATQSAASVAITGGTINGTSVGATTAAAVTATQFTLKDAGGDSQFIASTSANGCELSLRDADGTEQGLIRAFTAGLASMAGSDDLTLAANTSTGLLSLDGASLSFFAAAGSAKQTVSGSRGGNAALASLLSALSAYGLITDSTTA